MHSWRNGRRNRLRSGRLTRHGGSSPPGCTIFVARCHAEGMLPACPPTHRAARFAKRPRHRSYTPTFPGSSPGASTNPTPSHVAQRQSTRPITGRPRFDTVRENQFHRSIGGHHDHQNNGAACRRIFTSVDPERSSLRRLGSGLLIRALEVQLLPGSATAISICTRLAQSVRAPSS